MEFRNSKGYSSAVLRVKIDEPIADAVARLQGDGWIIDAYDVSEDPNGHSILLPRKGAQNGIDSEDEPSTEPD